MPDFKDASHGSAVALVGAANASHAAFVVGSCAMAVASTPGQLFVGVNDSDVPWSDGARAGRSSAPDRLPALVFTTAEAQLAAAAPAHWTTRSREHVTRRTWIAQNNDRIGRSSGTAAAVSAARGAAALIVLAACEDGLLPRPACSCSLPPKLDELQTLERAPQGRAQRLSVSMAISSAAATSCQLVPPSRRTRVRRATRSRSAAEPVAKLHCCSGQSLLAVLTVDGLKRSAIGPIFSG